MADDDSHILSRKAKRRSGDVEEIRNYIKKNGPLEFEKNDDHFWLGLDRSEKFRLKRVKKGNLQVINTIPGVWVPDKWIHENIDLLRRAISLPPSKRADPEEPTESGGGGASDAAPSSGEGKKPSIWKTMGRGASYASHGGFMTTNKYPESEPKDPKEEAKEEVRKIARWLIRKMPETSFDMLKPIFDNYPRVRTLVEKEKKVTESEAAKILWEEYRSWVQSDTNLSGSDADKWWKRTVSVKTPRELFRKGLGYKVPKRGLFGTEGETPGYKMIRDPLLRSAINRGRRVLRKAAKDYYKLNLRNAEKRMKVVKDEYDSAEKAVKDLRDEISKWLGNISKGKGGGDSLDFSKILDISPEKLAEKVPGLIDRIAGKSEDEAVLTKAEFLKEDLSRLYTLMDEKKKVLEEIQKESDPRNFYNNIYGMLNKEAESITPKLAAGLGSGGGQEYWKYGQFGDVIKGELGKEADYLAKYYARRAQTKIMKYMPRGSLALRSASMMAQTGGEAWTQFLHNTWNFVFGPWTIGTIFVLIQFFFTLAYVGYNLQFLYVMPAIAAGVTFILNFADTTRPFDWITHLASGAMIGYSAEFFLIALGANTWSFISGTASVAFWIAWAILVFIGIFQFYQT